MDEKASRRGHSYVTLFADLDQRRLLYATEGRKWGVLAEFRADLEAHGGSVDGIGELCMDMSPAYIKGARESFPDAEITFDRFHVVKLLNEAVEKIRRTEQKERPELKRSRWLWLWNPDRLSPAQRVRLDELLDPSRIALATARAYQLKLSFQEFLESASGAGQAASRNDGARSPRKAVLHRWPPSQRRSARTLPASSVGFTPGSATACWKP